MADFIDAFLDQLEADKSKPRTDFSRLNKLTMNAPDNQGTLMFAPFMSKEGSAFYKKLGGVRELKTAISMFHDGEDEVWCKILAESDYGELSEEDHNLYNEVAGLFDQLKECVEETDGNSWGYIRYRTYSLFQGIILKHSNTSNMEITDNKGVAALLIYPSKGPIDEMSKAIASRINNLGNKTWVAAVFSPTVDKREGAMSISFMSKTNGQPGYDCQVAFEFNSTFSKVIPDNFTVDEETLNLFSDYTSSFLGWENDNENGKTFNRKLFEEFKQILTIELKKYESRHSQTPKEENKNGVDPMLDAKPTEEAFNEATTEAPKAEEKKDDFPF